VIEKEQVIISVKNSLGVLDLSINDAILEPSLDLPLSHDDRLLIFVIKKSCMVALLLFLCHNL
jgi:hypothetical protein